MTPSQYRAKVRQLQNKQRRAINDYNNEVRKFNRQQQALARRLRNL